MKKRYAKNKYEEYIMEAALSLYNFQLIEEALKDYILSCIKKIKEKTKGVIPFKYDGTWIDKDSLGTLINKFEKMNSNQVLIKELKRLKPYRDKIAHKGLLITVEEWNNKSLVDFKISDLQKLRNETKLVLSQMLIEQKSIENL